MYIVQGILYKTPGGRGEESSMTLYTCATRKTRKKGCFGPKFAIFEKLGGVKFFSCCYQGHVYQQCNFDQKNTCLGVTFSLAKTVLKLVQGSFFGKEPNSFRGCFENAWPCNVILDWPPQEKHQLSELGVSSPQAPFPIMLYNLQTTNQDLYCNR